ncbi:twin-arginine translocase TatA/TatE family subunit [Deferrisoma camini]|uniref:twin-arginine translocase TatA/TatE family subunit n=1 Tax=Deferrisoma camini TaxID=1035120 RepID=UPI00046D7D64|nr:twin-arginine translocase TatA/TatE family subunit [Deferrisoma camini]NOY45106.1 twin-arginine translocase TatA/TatE family subunit [Deltaproteobacteria bacterium]
MFGMPGGSEWLIILLIVLVIFGGKKIPELMGGLGKGIKSFKKAMNEPDAIDVTPEKKEEIPHEAAKEDEGEKKTQA